MHNNSHSNQGNFRRPTNHEQRPWNPPRVMNGVPQVSIFFKKDAPAGREELLCRLAEKPEFKVPERFDSSKYVVVNLATPTFSNDHEQHYRLPQALLMSHLADVGGVVRLEVCEEWQIEGRDNAHIILIGNEEGGKLPHETACCWRPPMLINEQGVRVQFRLTVAERETKQVSVLHIVDHPHGLPWNTQPLIARYDVMRITVSVDEAGIRITNEKFANPYRLKHFPEMEEAALKILSDPAEFRKFYMLSRSPARSEQTPRNQHASAQEQNDTNPPHENASVVTDDSSRQARPSGSDGYTDDDQENLTGFDRKDRRGKPQQRGHHRD